MKRLLIVAAMVAGLWAQGQAITIAYVVNNDTTYANLTYDRQWIDFFTNDMGYTVTVITDDKAGSIADPDTAAFDGYFLSATMTSANLTNLQSTTKGVVICDQLMYDDFLVAEGQTAVTLLTSSWTLLRYDSTHFVTRYMFDRIRFDYAANNGSYAYTGIPSGATVLFYPSNKNWNGEVGTPDTAFCYAIEAGGNLTTGTAAGRRAVANTHYALLTQSTDGGWCHPKELLGNICAWAWGDTLNAYLTDYNCYSNDIALDPGPEVNQAWTEYGANYRYIYSNGRIGHDGMIGLMFFQSRFWGKKAMPGFEPDSFKLTYKIAYAGFGTDNPPHLYDTVDVVSVNSSTSMTIDTTTRDLSNVSTYDWFFQGSQGYAIVVRSGSGGDTTQVGDTCRISRPTSTQNSSALNYTISASSVNPSGIWNGTAGSSIRLLVADPYGGFDFWLKMYDITPTTVWTAPLASSNQGGNPEGSATRTWVNRNFIKSGNTDSVRWNAINLTPGTDHPQAAVDSFRVNRTTFAPDGSSTMEFIIPGSYLNNDNFNWVVFKSIDSSAANDSTDIEIIPQSFNTVRGSYVQKAELFLSGASPLTIAPDSTVLHVTGEVDSDAQFLVNYIRNSGDGVLLIDAVTDNQSWVTQTVGGSGGSTPLLVEHAISMAGTAGTDTATITITASTADNTPQTYLIIRTLTGAVEPTPAATVEKRTGLRKQ